MIMYFFDQWRLTGSYPEKLIDDNVKTDYGRLSRLLTNPDNREVLLSIIKNEQITAEIVSKFSFERMYDQRYFVSLLFYLGMLTITGTRYGMTELGIPNFVIKTVYWEYIGERLKEEYNLICNLSAKS